MIIRTVHIYCLRKKIKAELRLDLAATCHIWLPTSQSGLGAAELGCAAGSSRHRQVWLLQAGSALHLARSGRGTTRYACRGKAKSCLQQPDLAGSGQIQPRSNNNKKNQTDLRLPPYHGRPSSPLPHYPAVSPLQDGRVNEERGGGVSAAGQGRPPLGGGGCGGGRGERGREAAAGRE